MIQTSQGPLIARDRPRKMHQVIVPINLNWMRASIINLKTERVEQEFRAHSYVANFLRLFLGLSSESAQQVKRMSDGALAATGNQIGEYKTTGSTGLAGQGILMGSNVANPVIDNWELGTRLTADITYSAMGYTAPTIGSGSKYFDMFRTVTANADAISITELGLAAPTAFDSIFLYAHDKIATAVNLNTDQARILRYRNFFSSLWPAYTRFFFRGMENTTAITTPDIGGTARTIHSTSRMGIIGGIDVTTKGILISHAAASTAWDANTIADLYPTTDFYHAAVAFGTIVIDAVADTASFTAHRDFINISGVAKSVREYGLFFNGGSVTNWTFLGHAGTLTAPVSVGASEGLRITYKFSIET